jgi:polysaccharide export outer membrane protein
MGSSDVIEVQVWKEAELTRVMSVRSDGKVSLPLVGEVVASGKTTSELEGELARGYKQFVENPVVTVMVLQANSSKFYVTGQVQRPGEYSLPRGITVLQAISTAGGFTEWADQKSLVLVRAAAGQPPQRLRINYNKVVSGARPQDNCILLPGDTIVVP